jgi:DNA-binding NtrC family response regulator
MSTGKTRVLVIDDDAELRELIRGALELEGFEVAIAADGARGLESQRGRPAHIVITDVYMPEKEGMETLVVLRKEFPRAKIIVISGGGAIKGVDYLRLAMDLGAARSFAKPFKLQALSDAVCELARTPASSRDAPSS